MIWLQEPTSKVYAKEDKKPSMEQCEFDSRQTGDGTKVVRLNKMAPSPTSRNKEFHLP